MNDSDIRQEIEIGDLTIVRKYPSEEGLKTCPQFELNRNIEAYDQNGNLVWVIEEAPDGGANQDKAYMKIWLEEGRLIAGNWIGIDYLVDVISGKVGPINFNARPW